MVDMDNDKIIDVDGVINSTGADEIKNDICSPTSGMLKNGGDRIEMTDAARAIYDDVERCTNDNCYVSIMGGDISNYIVDGREIYVTNRMIERSYAMFNEIINATNEKNMTRIIIYACKIADREFLKTWQDKQMLVLLILHRYVDRRIERDIQHQQYLFIEAHVPIIVEKILHPRKRIYNIIKTHIARPLKFIKCRLCC